MSSDEPPGPPVPDPARPPRALRLRSRLGTLRGGVSLRRLIWALAVLAPVVTALALIPGRGHLSVADDALVLIVVTVAVASSGNRGAAALAALVSALAFDFFLTRPYGSLAIHRQSDLTTELLFVLVGLLVGELAARGHAYRRAALEGRHDLDRIRGVAEQIVEGEEPEFVMISVAAQLTDLLALQDCRFVRRQPSRRGAWIQTDGTVRLNPLQWPTSSAGLPTSHVELPVRGGGEVLGVFVLTPTPAEPISHDRCVVAVALADQLGAALASHPDTGLGDH
jgi:K+-sensing histidine kinase KdpD